MATKFKYALFSLLFSGLALAYILRTHQGELPFGYLLKVLPLLLLLGYVAWHWRSLISVASQRSYKWWLFGLSFGMVGDVLLAIDGQQLFVFGLAAFLVGHLGYLQALRPFSQTHKRLLVPYGAYATAVIWLMWPQLGAMAAPVLVYISVILAMSLATWVSVHSNRLLQYGGLLFIASDSLIGLNKFWQPIPHAGSLIMLTYYAAQWLIAFGLLRRAAQI